ncbi:uncharacterized protein [Aristolochia californica]|uniref:uncharacterized protein n=1 Tax=Aristolochia californica TaxID=171875 RepID=UPI0035E1EFC1
MVSSRALSIVTLVLRLLTLALLGASIFVLATDKIAFSDGSKVRFKDVIAYRFVMATAVLGCLYTLFQIPFAMYYVFTEKRLIRNKCLPQLDFYADKIVAFLLATGVGAGFAVTFELKKSKYCRRPPVSGIPLFGSAVVHLVDAGADSNIAGHSMFALRGDPIETAANQGSRVEDEQNGSLSSSFRCEKGNSIVFLTGLEKTEAAMGFAAPHLHSPLLHANRMEMSSFPKMRNSSTFKWNTGLPQAEGNRRKRAMSWRANAFFDWSIMAVLVEHIEGQRDYILHKSVWHLSDESIKNVYTMYIMFTCWGCCFFGAMKDPFYDGETYRKEGGDGTVHWFYEKQEDIEESARAELWREELIEEIEQKVGGLRELEEAGKKAKEVVK